jgi:signal-transduction protein with cAMP-binding, CBS, and nucleotidyltransferase domain
MATPVSSFMTQPVYSCSLPCDVGHVRDLMKQKECHAMLLVEVASDENIQLKGIVTSDDLLGVYDDTVAIQQVMQTAVESIKPSATAQHAAALMIRQGIHHLVVMDEQRIVGMLSSQDFVALVATHGI